MTEIPRILAIDCATRFGFAFGEAGQKPVSGSKWFTRDGKKPKGGSISNGAKFSNALRYAAEAAKEFNPTHIYCEAPIAPNAKTGQTSTAVMLVLYGLPAALQGMFYTLGHHHWDFAHQSSVRSHFIGKGNGKGEAAKAAVQRKCVALGWMNWTDPDISTDRADALALWSYAEMREAPKLCQPVDELFVNSLSRRRA